MFEAIKMVIFVNFCYSCLIKGVANESPAVIAFQENFKDGANLTIVSILEIVMF